MIWCGVVGPVVFMLVALIEGAMRPGYRPWRNFVSQLALGERGWVQTTNFVVSGILGLVFAVGLARTSHGIAFPVLFGIFGLGLIASGVFPCDPGLGYPPGAPPTWPRTASRSGNLHNLGGALTFGSVIVASFVAAARSADGYRIYSIATGIAVPILFVATGALATRGAGDPPIGLVQRLAIGIGWTWMAVFALRLT
ncbi:MAG: DUF998 domain-containing protein [Kofleriaceae bacterium]